MSLFLKVINFGQKQMRCLFSQGILAKICLAKYYYNVFSFVKLNYLGFLKTNNPTMRIKKSLLLCTITWLSFTGLFYSCTTIGQNKQETRFLNDSRENYQDAANRNLEITDEPWRIKHVYGSWEDIHMARLFEHNGSDFLVVAYGDYNSGYYLESCILEKETEYNHFTGSHRNFG